mgnify:CR=1 FL=1
MLVLIIVVASSQPIKQNSWCAYALLILISLGFLFSAYQLYQGGLTLLSYRQSWKIATGSLGVDFRHAIFGSGPQTFLSDFSQFRNLEHNATATWNMRFGSAGSELLNLLATGGFGLILAVLAVVLTGIRYLRNYYIYYRHSLSSSISLPASHINGLVLGLSLSTLCAIFLPFPFLMYFVVFALLGLLFSQLKLQKSPGITEIETASLNVGVPIGLIGLIGLICLFFLGRFWLAEFKLQQSVNAANRNDGRATYTLQLEAQRLNSWQPGYFMALAQTNLLIADNLASRKDLTDADKQTIQGLIQQSIAFARAATALSPNNPIVWENLAGIYRNLLNFAEGADQWAVAAYQQVIATDPLNPRIRLDLGGIFFAKKDYQNAALNFQNAVNLKPDYANARYNLAQAYLNLNMIEAGRAELTATQNLICPPAPDAADCKKVEEELKALPTPSPTPTPEASPSPSAPNTPTPTPKSTAAPRPKITITPKATLSPTTTPAPPVASPLVSP